MPHYSILCVATRQTSKLYLSQLTCKLSELLLPSYNTASSSVTSSLQNGVIRSIEYLGLRPLAYRMKAHQQYNLYGQYLQIQVTCSPAILQEMEKRLRFDDSIIRYLTLKYNIQTLAQNYKQINSNTHNKNQSHDNNKNNNYNHTQNQDQVEQKQEEEEEDEMNEESIYPPSSFDPVLATQPIFVDTETMSLMRTTPFGASVDYYAAKALLDAGLLSANDILSLPRHQIDHEWDLKSKTLQSKQSQAIFSSPDAAALSSSFNDQSSFDPSLLQHTSPHNTHNLHLVNASQDQVRDNEAQIHNAAQRLTQELRKEETTALYDYHTARAAQVELAKKSRQEWQQLEEDAISLRSTKVLDEKLIAKRTQRTVKKIAVKSSQAGHKLNSDELQVLHSAVYKSQSKVRAKQQEKREPVKVNVVQ